MRRILAGLLIFSILISSAAAAPIINPSVESEPMICRFYYTAWVCDIFGGRVATAGPQGLQGIPGEGNIKFGASTVNTTTIEGGDYIVVQFTIVGTTFWEVPDGVTEVEYVVVGGGGSGAGQYAGGGGGAGAFRSASNFSVDGIITVVVGAGGAAPGAGVTVGNKGGDSSFSTIISEGGGAGWNHGTLTAAANGGSGGGGGDNHAGGTANNAAYGNNGGTGTISAGAGGGGKGSVGVNGVSEGNAGAGGAGIASSITGESIVYAAGGGGSGYYTGGAGGSSGIGGHGQIGSSGEGLTNGTAGTGSGGGGRYVAAANASGVGGSGIVIIRYTQSGSSTNINAISHDFGSTPTAVLVTPSISNEIASVIAINSTTFTVSVTKPDGSCGSNQTIYWMVA
jgi:hypothetical protein